MSHTRPRARAEQKRPPRRRPRPPPRPMASSNDEAGTTRSEEPLITAPRTAGVNESSAASNAPRPASGSMASRHGSLAIETDRRPAAIA